MADHTSGTGLRWPRVLAIVALVLVLVLGLGLVVLVDRVPRDEVDAVSPGRLKVAEGAIGSWSVGSVDVELSAEALRMTDPARDDLVVWESPAGTSFVVGVLGSLSWQDYRGYFWPTTRHECELVDQEVRSATDDGGRLEVSGLLTGCGRAREYVVEVRPGPTRGDVTLAVEARDVDALGLVTGRTPGAGVHGLGEQFAPFDLSGRIIPIVVREQGVGRGEQPLTFLADVAAGGVGGTLEMTYAAWPSFVTDDVRGVAFDPDVAETHAFAVADTRHETEVVLTSWSPRIEADLTAEEDPRALLVRRGAKATRPGLPDWVLSGAVLGVQGGTDAVRQVVADLQDEGAALSAVWLQDWTGTRPSDIADQLWWTGQLDEQRYPGWDDMVADFSSDGIRVLTYVNPWLVDATDKGDTSIRNLFQEAADAGYLVRDPQGETYLVDQGGFDAALVDLTNPQARDWYAETIATEVFGQGVDGFMADSGEGLPFDAVLADGDPRFEHNRWPSLMAATVRDACDQADRPDCVVWFHTGSAGIERFAPLFWNGDQVVTYSEQDGMPSALLGTFSAGVSGWHLTHSDVGGYKSIDALVRDYTRPAEMNQRWAEMEAFGVVMRTHEGNRPTANAQVYDTPEARRAFARMTRLFAALAPYRSEVVREAQETAVPALRHGWLEYPGTAAADSDTQFFFGSSVLVAPVFGDGRDQVSVTLPPGTWVHLLTGERFDGDQVVDVDAPLGTPAAFVRADDPALADLQAMVVEADL